MVTIRKCFLFVIINAIVQFTGVSQTSSKNIMEYYHQEKVSFTSKLFQRIFGVMGIKKGSMFIKRIEKGRPPQPPIPPLRSLIKKYEVDEHKVAGNSSWTISPKNKVPHQIIIYLHGGGYCYGIKKFHWQLVDRIIEATDATVIVPDYPLGPESTCLDAYHFLDVLYEKIQNENGTRDIIFVGDSSGGGLAFGFAMQLRDDKMRLPKQIILLSPWLDVTLSNKEIIETDKKDKILGISPLQLVGKFYAGDLDVKDFRISPIYGDLHDMPTISAFIGSHDIFVSDVRKLRDKMKASNLAFNYFEYPTMFHGWIMVKKLREAEVAFHQMTELIIND